MRVYDVVHLTAKPFRHAYASLLLHVATADSFVPCPILSLFFHFVTWEYAEAGALFLFSFFIMKDRGGGVNDRDLDNNSTHFEMNH
jgi:hypothetical protein